MNLARPFDLILLSCKAYDLEDAIASFAPAVGPETAILPLLNGMAHLGRLETRFGAEAVLGGTCFISTTIGPDGEILHMNDLHRLTYGDRRGGMPARIDGNRSGLCRCRLHGAGERDDPQRHVGKVDFHRGDSRYDLSDALLHRRLRCRGRRQSGIEADRRMRRDRRGARLPLSKAADERIRENLTRAGSPITASMLRDIQAGGRIESDQIIGDFLNRADPVKRPSYFMLETVYAHLKAYEVRRAREG